MVANCPQYATVMECARAHSCAEQRVSVELCKAVADELAPGELDEIDVDFRWAIGAARPVAPVGALSFPAEVLEPISEIAGRLKTMPRERQDIVYGVIEDLHDSEAEPDTVIGIRALVDNRVRAVWVNLEAVLPPRAQVPRQPAARRRPRHAAHPPHNRRATMTSTYFGAEDTLDTFEPPNSDHRNRYTRRLA